MSSRKSLEPDRLDTAESTCGCESTEARGLKSDEKLVVPVIEEELQVSKRTIEKGGLRVRMVVHEREQVVDVPLEREELSIERVAVDRFVEGPQEARTEGDTLIIPVVEEVVVVERRWKLKEELRVTRNRRTESASERVTLRREEAVVERLDNEGVVSALESGASVKPARQRS